MMETNLACLKVGEKGIVNFIDGGRAASKRLYEMGFNRGTQVNVIKNDRGPLIVSLGGNKVAIGWGIAQKIMIRPGAVE
ncbi:MAG TPA: ferrous iron transport protein A [Clostridia bacterium]|nr:ferrous iron transport protein A [Clostridia bacterium]